MLDKILKLVKQGFYKQDNGVTSAAETSPYVNIEGVEKKISVPQPTAEDRKWARKLRNASTNAIGSALGTAIASNQNWRVWYLLNRPQRKSGGVILPEKDHGFKGNTDVADGIAKAAEHNNVTAAYLLLKYAEKNHTATAAGADKARTEVQHYTVNGLENAANKNGADVFMLLAKTLTTLVDASMHPTGNSAPVDYQSVLKKSAIRAGAAGNAAHLDSMLNNGLLNGQQMVEAFMTSFDYKKTYAAQADLTPGERANFLGWLVKRGIVDQTFADEAQAVDVRMTDAKTAIAEAAARGWKPSDRALPASDDAKAPTAPQVEITLPVEGKKSGITYVFNFSAVDQAARIHRVTADTMQEIPAKKLPDAALLDEGRVYAESLGTQMPELSWKKGEPFRLRFKP
ncbi:MAG: hypothetical protein PW788_05380 [Micavibrio sp.]|nr:hypothetical protein [Micavibrio sp.]